MVGTFDDIEVVLDDKYAVPTVDEGIEGMQQPLDVVEVQACRRFVEDEERGELLPLPKIVSELHSLVLPTRERRSRLSELDVP